MVDISKKWPWPGQSPAVGTFPEELKELQRFETNIDASPVPEAHPTHKLDPKNSSDSLRLGRPTTREMLPEASRLLLQHVVIRRLLHRSRSPNALLFDEAVETESLADLPDNRKSQMRSMLARERAMLDLLERYNHLAESVYARILSEVQG